MKDHDCPLSVDSVAYQFPEKKILPALVARLGSPTLDVCEKVADGGKAMFLRMDIIRRLLTVGQRQLAE
jgi:hypothetical protein